MQSSELLNVMKETVEFLQASEVTQTSVGIQAYIQGQHLEKQIAKLEAEIAEEDAYFDQMAQRLGY